MAPGATLASWDRFERLAHLPNTYGASLQVTSSSIAGVSQMIEALLSDENVLAK